MANEIDRPEPPALPLATEDYSVKYFDQLNNVLRFFFTRISANFDALMNQDSGGRFLHFPYAVLYNDANQVLSAASVNAIDVPDTRHITQGMELLSGNDSIQVTYRGAYRVDVKANVATAGTVLVWLSKNGTSASDYIADTTNKFESVNSKIQIVTSYIVELGAGDNISVLMNPSASATLTADSSSGSGIPATEINVTFVGNA